MKTLLSMVLLLITMQIKAYCQSFDITQPPFGLSENEIVNNLSKRSPVETLIERGDKKNGVVSLLYMNTDLVNKAYIFLNDKCIEFTTGAALAYLPKFIQLIGKDYKKVGDNKWYDKRFTYQITIKTDENNFYGV
ncbi:MAG: hypothetical protein Q7U83_03450, partial [Daejeonella sp.]|nr:hypothetical protein [Daejeonella sp.]